tara:strand:- start:522 stop:1415 length:894 start_codon:yes stop_codon:yes gene_type:complete
MLLMKRHDKITRNLFNKIHLKQIKTPGYKRVVNLLSEKNLNLPKDFFKDKICADLGCGSTGAGALNLLNLGAKEVHLMDMHKHIFKPIKQNLKKHDGKFKIHVGSLEKLPFKNNFFDFVLCQGVIHHMDDDKKGFKEIHRVLKKGGKTHIVVQGNGGLIPKIMYNVIIPQYKKNPLVKKLLNEIMDNKIYKYKRFFNLNLNKKGVKLVKFLSRYFDEDFRLTMKDRVLSPNYYQYEEKKLIKNLNKLGLKKTYRIKKKVQFNNIRALVAPMYYEYDHLISRVLYGDGDIAILSTKTK